MQFNQVNNNKGDVNNAIATNGDAVQSVGENNVTAKGTAVHADGDNTKVKVEQPKDGIWAAVCKKIVGFFRWVFGAGG